MVPPVKFQMMKGEKDAAALVNGLAVKTQQSGIRPGAAQHHMPRPFAPFGPESDKTSRVQPPAAYRIGHCCYARAGMFSFLGYRQPSSLHHSLHHMQNISIAFIALGGNGRMRRIEARRISVLW